MSVNSHLWTNGFNTRIASTKRKKSISLTCKFPVEFLTFSVQYFLYYCVFNVGKDESQVFRHALIVEAFRALGVLHEPYHMFKSDTTPKSPRAEREAVLQNLLAVLVFLHVSKPFRLEITAREGWSVLCAVHVSGDLQWRVKKLRGYALVRAWLQRLGKSVWNKALFTESCCEVSIVTVRSQLVFVRK